eukprot:scaffold140506_cov21-Tisochrysis_lutea.AAC.1
MQSWDGHGEMGMLQWRAGVAMVLLWRWLRLATVVEPRLVRLILNPCTKRYVHGKPHVKAILMKMERVLQRGVHVQDRFQRTSWVASWMSALRSKEQHWTGPRYLAHAVVMWSLSIVAVLVQKHEHVRGMYMAGAFAVKVSKHQCMLKHCAVHKGVCNDLSVNDFTSVKHFYLNIMRGMKNDFCLSCGTSHKVAAGLFHVPPSFVSYCIRTELFAHDIRRIGRKCMGKSDSSKKWRAIGELKMALPLRRLAWHMCKDVRLYLAAGWGRQGQRDLSGHI